MKYTQSFKLLIEESIKENQVVGLGNPNSNILFVGKEAGIAADQENYHGSGQSWKDSCINYAKRYVPEDPKHRNGNHTWQKYQLLYELIRAELKLESVPKNDKYEITFVEDIFTSELSNLHAPESNEAKQLDNFREELDKRKQTFWKSDFIKEMPIIIIFASDPVYIESYPGELCNLFGVNFHEQKTIDKSKIWINLSENGEKLVLHTRQLTQGASLNLLKEIAKIIAKFMTAQKISFIR